MKKNIFGRGSKCYVARATAIDDSGGSHTPVTATISLDDVDNVAIQLVTTGTIAGVWTSQASNDHIQGDVPATQGGIPQQNPGTFSAYTGFGAFAAVLTGGSSQIIEKVGFSPRALKLIFTPSAGVGTYSIIVFAKGND